MKKIIYTILLTMVLALPAFAKGKFIFMPKGSYTKNENSLSSGLSIYEHISGPFSYSNWTGIGLDKALESAHHDLRDFTFRNGIVAHLGSTLDVEMGHQMTHNFKTKFTDHEGYVKVSAQLWK
jgi:hypothetical protein